MAKSIWLNCSLRKKQMIIWKSTMARTRKTNKANAPKPATVTPRDLAAEIMTAARNGRQQHYFDAIAEILLVWLLGEPTELNTERGSRAGTDSMDPNPDHKWPASGIVKALNRAQELSSQPASRILDLPAQLKYEEPITIRFGLMDAQHAIRNYIHIDRIRSHSPYYTLKGVDKYCAEKPL